MKTRWVLTALLCVLLRVPGAGQEPPFHFALLADTQMGMYASDRDFVRETANYEFAAATVNRLRPEFVVILGDLVNRPGDPDQVREFKRITGRITVPVHLVAGNHDIGHEPTPESLAAYRRDFGRDYYSFRAGPVYGIVLNSGLIHSPRKVADEYARQAAWLREELAAARKSGAPHVIVFQHHPWFVADAGEANGYSNIPAARRQPMLELLREYGVRQVFAGHAHQDSTGRAGDLEMTVTGPVSMPFGDRGSGMRLVEVGPGGVRHRYFDFSRMPDALSLEHRSPF